MKTMMEKIIETSIRANDLGLDAKFVFKGERVEYIEISTEDDPFSGNLLILWGNTGGELDEEILISLEKFVKEEIEITAGMMKFFLETHEMFCNPEIENDDFDPIELSDLYNRIKGGTS